MKALCSRARRTSSGWVALMCLASGWAVSQTPLVEPSLDALRAELTQDDVDEGGLPARAFKKAATPTVDGLCHGLSHSPHVTEGVSRNLVVVPYTQESAVLVQLALSFERESDELSPQSRKVLDRLATVLNEPGTDLHRFAVAGHTDSTGRIALNDSLSCARALSVKTYLESKGVASSRLSAYGFGSRRPLTSFAASDSRQRRVEIRRAAP